MSATQFSTTTKVFHWLTALLILTIIPLGVIAGRLPFETDAQIAQKTLLFSLHKTLGITVFVVALARIAYALTQTKPAPLHPDRRAETFLAEVVHWLLYVSLVLVPLTGWIHHASAAVAAPVWIPFANSLPFVPVDPTVSDLFGGLHWIWSKIMVASILLHIAGALKHHFIDRDATLRRMWFGNTQTPPLAHKTSRLPAIVALGIYAIVAGLGAAAGLYSHSAPAERAALEAAPSEWQVETGTIAVTITQLGNTVTGQFENWTSAITFDETAQGQAGSVTTQIDVGSLTLGSLGAQAMGPDFFDQPQFATATYAADLIEDNGSYRAEGTLTIKDQSIPLAFGFDLDVTDNVANMTGQTTLDRRNFGIGDSVTDEANLGFQVDVTLSLNAIK